LEAAEAVAAEVRAARHIRRRERLNMEMVYLSSYEL
jgi:hypothetical protein